jgi:hypothetical protein
MPIASASVTITVTDWLADPPAPVQAMVYVAVTVGETLTEPDVPDAEKPVPLHAVALALLQVSVEDRPLEIEGAEAERIAVGLGAVAACAAAIVEYPAGCEGAPMFCGGMSGRISRSAGVAASAEAGIRVVFDRMLELGVELTACPEVSSGKMKPRPIIAGTDLRNISLYLC